MGEIVTYRNAGTRGVFSQIRLESGERILLSMAQTGFRVSKLVLGVIPTETLWDIRQEEILAKLTDASDPAKHPLDVAIALLKDCKSIEAVRAVTASL